MISNSSGKIAVSAVTSTELSYLSGVTSNIQSQLNGKAPGGYGLGSSNGKFITSVTEFDNAVESGWYHVAIGYGSLMGASSTGRDFLLGMYDFEDFDGNTVEGTLFVVSGRFDSMYESTYQEFRPFTSNCIARRTLNPVGSWNYFEWINPPMILGKEYRTTERWNNDLPVYVKAIDLGNVPSNSYKSISSVVTDASGIIELKGIAYHTTDGYTYSLPLIDGDTIFTSLHLTPTDNSYAAVLTSNTTINDYKAYCIVKYIK